MAAPLASGKGGGRCADAVDRVNILLVDDQPARLLTYQTILSELGHNLVAARSGTEALEKLMRDEFAVVLLDVSMPGMDGFEAAHLIHEHPRYERTPIIFVTGVHVTELDRLKGYALGAVDYVSVPVVPEILRGKVAVLAELYCKRRELRELNKGLADANARLAEANLALRAEKTRELETLNATLQRSNSELASANRKLQSEVAERARAEQALKHADRKKDEFLALLAHELRNPLAPLLNALELMRLQPWDPQLGWARQVIERQTRYLVRLVDDLLDVSRITRGQITLSRRPVELLTLIERAVEMVQPLTLQRRQRISVAIEDRTLRVHGDEVRLVQAFGNVLGNAVKYTDGDGNIEVSVHRRHGSAEVRVRDDGIGIPADQLTGIFELFTRSGGGAHHAQSGLGIGLALVRRLVEMHGGTVTAYSDGPGAGSEFVIQLPLAAAAESDDGRSTVARTAAAAPVVRRRILVVDDNIDALDSTARLLELGGHAVFSATDGGMALQAAKHHLPDVVLLDIGMPVLDGYEVARRIRAEPWGRNMTLVAITGWGQESDRLRAQEAGFDSHLVKPVHSDKLAALLARPPRAVQALNAGS
ncbi:MAG TPA: response regulator [Steroidobacteraceae bacterium]|nr:response regulator [Steroidobacteraceae bacterium]